MSTRLSRKSLYFDVIEAVGLDVSLLEMPDGSAKAVLMPSDGWTLTVDQPAEPGQILIRARRGAVPFGVIDAGAIH